MGLSVLGRYLGEFLPDYGSFKIDFPVLRTA